MKIIIKRRKRVAGWSLEAVLSFRKDFLGNIGGGGKPGRTLGEGGSFRRGQSPGRECKIDSSRKD